MAKHLILILLFCFALKSLAIPRTHKGRAIIASMDVYPPPLFVEIPPMKVTGQARLDYAIAFLQVKRVRELVKNRKTNGIDVAAFGNDLYHQSPLHQICQAVLSNWSYEKYKSAYLKITAILLKTNEIDFWQKDIFGNTAMDTCKRNLRNEQMALIKYYRQNGTTKPINTSKNKPNSDKNNASSMADDHECCICLDEPKDMALIPCGHVVGAACCKDLNTCPTCRNAISATLKIYY